MKDTAINISILLATLAVFFIAAEIFLRIFYPQPTYAVEYAPWGWRHMSNVSFIHGSEHGGEFVTKIHYNSKGLRDYREFSYEKPKGTCRIEVFGDSYAEGIEVPYEKNLCKVLEDSLNANPPEGGKRYEVMNFGVYAYDTAQEFLYFKNEGVKYQPDLVILIYTTRDPETADRSFLKLDNGRIEENLFTVSETQKVMRLIRGYIKSHCHFLTFLINRTNFMGPSSFKKGGKNFTLINTLPYRNSDEEMDAGLSGRNWELVSAIFKEFKAEADRAGARLLIVSTHIDPVKFKKHIEVRREFCAANDIDFLVSYDFNGRDRSTFHYAFDGHWNEFGHARIARLIRNKIVSDNLVSRK